MADTEDKKLHPFVSLSHSMHSPVKPSPIISDSTPDMPPTAHEIEVAKLQLFLMKNLPNAGAGLLQALSQFLLEATPLKADWQSIVDDRLARAERSATASRLAEELLNSGFGHPAKLSLNKKAIEKFIAAEQSGGGELSRANKILNLTTMLLEAPASKPNVADRTLRLEFSEWKRQFVAALQGRESFVGNGRAR